MVCYWFIWYPYKGGMNLKDNNKKFVLVCNWITVIFGLIALILQLVAGVEFNNPLIWILVFLIISSAVTLITGLKK